jgi:hypothetical protein
MNDFQSGAVLDTRPEAAKLKDFKFEELVSAADPVNWLEKPQDQWRKFPIFNQNGSGSCVAQTEAKELGIMRWLKDGNYVHFSATDIYQRRANKPAGGMGAADARAIVAKGATLEVLSPSQNMTDAQMDSAIVEPYKHEVGNVFSVPNYVEVSAKNIDTVASIIQRTKKGVMVWFYFEYQEWDQRPHVVNTTLDLYAPATARHSITGIDYTLLPGGKRAIIIEDSWGPNAGIGGQRIVDEDFFAARNWYAGYLLNFRFEDQTQPQPTPIPKPHHVFNIDLEFSAVVTYNPEVIALQDCLKYEGVFPNNVVSTGYFGAVTKKSVQAFQIKHSITTVDGPGYGRVGPKTRAKLNLLYGV